MTSDTERSAHPGHLAAGQHRATPPPRPAAIRGAALVGVLLVAADLTTKLFVAGLVLGGATANLFDRAAHGAVHDFLILGPVVVNLADLGILAGFAMAG